MGASRACFIFITLQLLSLATSQEVVKRVPQGFLGMRGKKYFGDETEQFFKRKPQFFVGVKGKKSLQEILETSDEFYKRAPMGFMGMRGKKESLSSFDSSEYVPKRDGSLIGQIDYTSNDNPNYKETFPLLDELLSHYLEKLDRPRIQTLESESYEDSPISMTNEIAKRAANMHQFFGVRGKKSLDNKRPYDLSFRGKFIGVRGKKDLKNSGAHEIKFLLDNPLPKRKSQMGFFGMRGKKWADAGESSQEMEMPN
ncbi:tachykinin [Anticarsia gemmatalis]|uniref:tachykinin n=1 Tax=Anticarsia gemmatalis TaxID=129554 RepID=UPI003F76CC70